MEKRFIGSENFHFVSNFIICPNLCEKCIYFSVRKGTSSYGDYHCDLSKVQGNRSSAAFHEYSNPHEQKTHDKCDVFLDKNESEIKKETSIADNKELKNNKQKNESADLSLEKLNVVAENVKRWHDTENEMIQNYLLNNRDKKIVENIKSKNNFGLLLKFVFSIFFIISSYIVLAILDKYFLIFLIILIWVIVFKYINHKILTIKRKIASSEMPNGRIDTDDIVIGKISIWDHKILDYLSSPEGKEWIKNIYNK